MGRNFLDMEPGVRVLTFVLPYDLLETESQ